jgi:hypothetical protein
MRNLKAWHFALGLGVIGGVGAGGYFAYQAATKSNPELSAGKKANSKVEAERVVAQADRHESTASHSGAAEATHQKAKAGAPSKKGNSAHGQEAPVGSQAVKQAHSHTKGVEAKDSHHSLAAHPKNGKSVSSADEQDENDEEGAPSHSVAGKKSAGTITVGQSPGHAPALSGHHLSGVEKATQNGVNGPTSSTGVQSCTSVEEFGTAPEQVAVTPEMWEKAMAVFHEAKARVVTWVSDQGAHLTREQKLRAIKSVEEVRLQRPPQAEQPDLSWRGIGVYTIIMDAAKLPQGVIRLGGGFVRLVQRDVGRARFELTRLVLQAVTPCELERVLGGERTAFWKPVQSCLNVETHSQECTLGGFSESTWALSSAVAAQVSPPGCQIANLTPEILGRCVAAGTSSQKAHASAEQVQAVGQVWSSLFGGLAPLISQGLLAERNTQGRESARVLAQGTTNQASAARGESLK